MKIMQDAKDILENPDNTGSVRHVAFFFAGLLLSGAWKFALEGIFED